MRVKNVEVKIGRLSPVTLVFLLAACLSGGGGDGNVGTAGAPTAPVFATCSSVTYAAPSGPTSNIVFNFNKAYQCGQFANGDWWVSADSSGFVTINSITPDGVVGRNGFQVNPADTRFQPYDNRELAGSYNGALQPALPLQVAGTSSVVKAVSSALAPGNIWLQYAATLTVLNSPLANSETIFRPAYAGTTKKFYSVGSIRTDLLPKYPVTGLPGEPTIADVIARYENVQLDHISADYMQYLHPRDNIQSYGAQIATDNAQYLLRLVQSDFDNTNINHKRALISYLQMAIDFEGMVIIGTKWNATGGLSIGRKLPLAFAAKIFNDPSFQAAIAAGSFDEDNLLYRSAVTSKVLYGWAASDAAYWQTTITSLNGASLGTQVGTRDARDPYQQIDGGGYEVGGGYQLCCTAMPWKYTALAVDMLGVSAQFNNTLLPEYVQRWVSTGAIVQPDTCAPFDGVPSNYGVTYGPNGVGGCIPDLVPGDGVGRWPSVVLLPDGGTYRSAFGDALWSWRVLNP